LEDYQAEHARADAAAAVVASTIFIFGGTAPGSMAALADLVMFSPRTMRWTRIDARGEPAPRKGCAMGASAGKLFVFGGLVVAEDGGFRVAGDLHVYDPEQYRWQDLTLIQSGSTPSARERASLCARANDSRLFLVGGLDPYGALVQDVFVYFPDTHRWGQVASVPAQGPASWGSWLAATVVDDRLIAALGAPGGAVELWTLNLSLSLPSQSWSPLASSGALPLLGGGGYGDYGWFHYDAGVWEDLRPDRQGNVSLAARRSSRFLLTASDTRLFLAVMNTSTFPPTTHGLHQFDMQQQAWSQHPFPAGGGGGFPAVCTCEQLQEPVRAFSKVCV